MLLTGNHKSHGKNLWTLTSRSRCDLLQLIKSLAFVIEKQLYLLLFFLWVKKSDLQKATSAAGFEPARVTPLDFKSNALTTRPN
jgi:hypothetical protein